MLTQEIVAKLIADNQQFNKAMNSSVAVMDKLNSKGQKVGAVVTEMAKNIDGTVKVIRKLDNDGKVLSERFITVAKSADEVSRALKKMKAEEEKIKSEKAREFSKAFSELATAAAASIFVVEKVGSAIKSAYDAASDGAKIMAAEQFFVNAGKSIDVYRQATKGLISDAKLMKKSNMASSMGIDEKTFLQLTKVAQAAALKSGQDFEYMFDSIIVGTARASRLLLDNLGIIVSVEQANKTYAASIGKTVEALSDEEKQLAFVAEVRKQSMGQIDEYGRVVDKSAESFSLLSAQVENFGDKIKKAMAEMSKPLVEGFGGWVQALNDMWENEGGAATFTRMGIDAGIAFIEAFSHVPGMMDIIQLITGQDFREVVHKMKDQLASEDQRGALSKIEEKRKKTEQAQSSLDWLNFAGQTHWSMPSLPKDLAELKSSTDKLDAVMNLTAEDLASQPDQVKQAFQDLQVWARDIAKHTPDKKTFGFEKTEMSQKGNRKKGNKEEGPPKTRKYDNPSESEFRKIQKDIADAAAEAEKLKDAELEADIDAWAYERQKEVEAAQREKATDDLIAKAKEDAAKEEKEAIEKVKKETDDYWKGVGQAWADFGKLLASTLIDSIFSILESAGTLLTKGGAGMMGGGIRGAASAGAAGAAAGGAAIGSFWGPVGTSVGGAIGSAVGEVMKGITGPFAMFFDVLDTFPMVKKLWDQFIGGFALVVQAFEPMGAIIEPVSRVIAMAFTGIAKDISDFLKSSDGLRFISESTKVMSQVAISIGDALFRLYQELGGAKGVSRILFTGLTVLTYAISGAIAITRLLVHTFYALLTVAVALPNLFIAMINGITHFLNWIDSTFKGGKAQRSYVDYLNPFDFISRDSPDLIASDLLGDDNKDNTDALKENTAAIRDFQREFRNLPSGFKVNAAMYRASNGVGPRGKTPYAPKDEMGEYTPPPRGKVNAEAAREIRRAKEEAARNPNRIEM